MESGFLHTFFTFNIKVVKVANDAAKFFLTSLEKPENFLFAFWCLPKQSHILVFQTSIVVDVTTSKDFEFLAFLRCIFVNS